MMEMVLVISDGRRLGPRLSGLLLGGLESEPVGSKGSYISLLSCFVFLMEKSGEGFSFLCTLLSTGRNVLQKPGLDRRLHCAVFPGMLILKLSKVVPRPFPLEGPREARLPCELGAGGRELPVWEPGSWGPLLLGSFSARP